MLPPVARGAASTANAARYRPPISLHASPKSGASSRPESSSGLGEGGYRCDHVRAFAQRVEVADDAIYYIEGSKGTLLRTLVAAKGGKSAGIGVPGFVPKWRAAVRVQLVAEDVARFVRL